VLNGNFDQAEGIMINASNNGLFDDYIRSLPYKPLWQRINSQDECLTPCMRGGHQMCIDSESGMIYLLGGWDGAKDLSDFWSFNENTGEWKCISMDTRNQGGPEPRSCHKICYDEKEHAIYTLGKYVDPESRPNVPLDSDFWKYDIASQNWIKLSSNTALEGGPELIYDHQMLVDSESGILYVFGGRIISPDPSQIVYSGLYSWSIKDKTWKMHRGDRSNQNAGIELKSRIGHSMVFSPITKKLLIFAGQRHKDFLADFYVYDIETDTVTEISRDYSKQGGTF
jgi:hypothetical protein